MVPVFNYEPDPQTTRGDYYYNARINQLFKKICKEGEVKYYYWRCAITNAEPRPGYDAGDVELGDPGYPVNPDGGGGGGGGEDDSPETVKAIHTAIYPTWGDVPERNDVFVEYGFNTVIMHNLISDSTDYSGSPDAAIGWSLIRDYTSWADSRNMAFHPVMSFAYNVDTYGRGFEKGVGEDGVETPFVSPWDVDYWDYLGDILVSLARFVRDSDDHRADGFFFDLEIYGHYYKGKKQPYLDRISWGYADNIWESYLASIGSGASVPIRSQRKSWLIANSSLDEYYLYLEDNIAALAKNLKDRIHAVNPDFMIGVYQSPNRNYYDAAIASGLSEPNDPITVWGTEMYIPWKIVDGELVVGVDLLPTLVPYSTYYNLTSLYGKEIYGFYVGGFVLRAYDDFEELPYHLFEVGDRSSGYWVYTGLSFSQSYTFLLSHLGYGYMVECDGGHLCLDEASYDARVAQYRAMFIDVNTRL